MGGEIWDEPVRGETFPPHLLGLWGQGDRWVAPFLRPVRGAVLDQEIFTTRTGLELIRGLVSGELPLSPVALLLGARPIEAGEGTCTFSMPATGWLTSPTGLVLGGVTACLADFALGAAMHTTVPPARPSRRPTFVFGSSVPRQATAAR